LIVNFSLSCQFSFFICPEISRANEHNNIVTCSVVRVTKITGPSSDDRIY
jgi:hypothetical protein